MPDSPLMSVMWVGDNHMTDRQPSMRSDDYGESGLAELREIFSVASDREVGLVVFLGDIFDKVHVGKEYLNSVLRAFSADAVGDPWTFRKAVVVGNHDIQHNMQFYPQSALCALVSAGVLEMEEFIPEYGIGFAHFRAGLDAEIADGLFADDPRKPMVWAAHANITTQPIFGDYVLFGDLKTNSECRLVVAGHVHIPMDAQSPSGVRFINPGNVGRPQATQENMGRDVRVLLTEYRLGGEVRAEYITLKSALSCERVFKVREIQDRKDIKKDTREFMERATRLAVWTSDDGGRVEDLLRSAKLKGIPDTVAKTAADAVREVMESKGKIPTPATTGVETAVVGKR